MSKVMQMDSVTSKTDVQVIKINILKITFSIIDFYVDYTVPALLVLDYRFFRCSISSKITNVFCIVNSL